MAASRSITTRPREPFAVSPSSARTPCSPARIAAPNRNYVGMIEREENAPTVDTLEKLAEVLQVEPTSLLQR